MIAGIGLDLCEIERMKQAISRSHFVDRVFTPAEADRIREEVTASFPSIKTTASTWNNLEFNIASANKGNSLRRFAEHLGFTLENCIAFGDGLNDLSMIEAAGTGVAMANAHPQVLAAADLVTATNDEDGVARTLRELGVS